MSDLSQQLDLMWSTLLQAKNSGVWYAAHPRAPGKWRDAEDIKNALQSPEVVPSHDPPRVGDRLAVV